MQYVALLRGINVGGNNAVSMAALRQLFETLGFMNVKTYINSGNVLFSAPEQAVEVLISQCEQAIETSFGFKVICSVITAEDLTDALLHAPDWWGTGTGDKHNALFIIPPATTAQVMSEVGEAKPEYEKVAAYGSVIFWSAPLKTFSRTRYSKIVGKQAYRSVTIRNSNTVKKLVKLIG